MIFSLFTGDSEPLLYMRGHARKQAGLSGYIGTGKNLEKLSHSVLLYKNRVPFPDIHGVNQDAHNQNIIRPNLRHRLKSKNKSIAVFILLSIEGTATPGGK